MFKNISDKLQIPFLFGIGGIGDFLLLMSDGNYDDNIEENLGLVFWANNPSVIKDLTKLFPKIKKTIITHNYLNGEVRKAHQYFDEILAEKLFLTKAHIPNHLDYIYEWYGCNVFKKYGIRRHPFWVIDWTILNRLELENLTNYSVYSPTGGSSDTDWKKKHIKKELFLKLLDEDKNTLKFIISTQKEMDNIYGHDFVQLELMRRDGVKLYLDRNFEILFSLIGKAQKVYSVDSWIKTFSAFANKSTILIESFYEYSPFIRMGLDHDPGDDIFIEGWGFEKIKQEN